MSPKVDSVKDEVANRVITVNDNIITAIFFFPSMLLRSYTTIGMDERSSGFMIRRIATHEIKIPMKQNGRAMHIHRPKDTSTSSFICRVT